MIVLLRHGETQFNVEGRLQGRLDSPLTLKGVSQARALGALVRGLVAGLGDVAIVTSPLGRARRTAEIVTQASGAGRFHVDDRLTEVSFGAWEGLTRSEIEDGWPHAQGTSPRLAWAAGCEGSEPFADAMARATSWLEACKSRHVIAISHLVTSGLIRGAFAGHSTEELLTLPAPQDAAFILESGTIRQIDTLPLAA